MRDNSNNVHFSRVRSICKPYLAIKFAVANTVISIARRDFNSDRTNAIKPEAKNKIGNPNPYPHASKSWSVVLTAVGMGRRHHQLSQSRDQIIICNIHLYVNRVTTLTQFSTSLTFLEFSEIPLITGTNCKLGKFRASKTYRCVINNKTKGLR